MLLKGAVNDFVDSSTDQGERHCSFQDFDASIVAYGISLSICRSKCSLASKVSIFQRTKESLFTDRTKNHLRAPCRITPC